MRKSLISVLVAQALIFNVAADQHPRQAENDTQTEVEELAPPGSSPVVNYQWSKEAQSAQHALVSANVSSIPLMTPHHDPANPNSPLGVMSTVNTTLIFWGSNWRNPIYASDKVVGLKYWYNNLASSTYKNTVSEYTSLNPFLKSSLLDSTATTINSSNPGAVIAEVCKVVGATNIDPKGYYPVYTDLKRGSAHYCAYHTAGSCDGVHTFQFAFFFSLDDDPGCNPQSSFAPPAGSSGSQKPGLISGAASSYQQSQGLAALANVTAHELAETVTDGIEMSIYRFLYAGGYYDIAGNEIGDKCAWTFGPSKTGAAPGTVILGAYDWKFQGEWSNKAQTTGIGGYATQGGLARGCITGS